MIILIMLGNDNFLILIFIFFIITTLLSLIAINKILSTIIDIEYIL